MNIITLLDTLATDVKAEDFHTVCDHLGRFAQQEASSLQRFQSQVRLLHAPHPSGLALFYLSTQSFVPRRHGTWSVVAPVTGELHIESWTEYVTPAEFTGDSTAHGSPDKFYRCEVGSSILVPENQLFSVTAESCVDLLLLCGEHPNHTWPESRLYAGRSHTERTPMYPETLPVSE